MVDCPGGGRTRQEDVEVSPTQSRISPSVHRILRLGLENEGRIFWVAGSLFRFQESVFTVLNFGCSPWSILALGVADDPMPPPYRSGYIDGLGLEVAGREASLFKVQWEGCHDSRRCSRDTFLEIYITNYTSIRRI